MAAGSQMVPVADPKSAAQARADRRRNPLLSEKRHYADRFPRASGRRVAGDAVVAFLETDHARPSLAMDCRSSRLRMRLLLAIQQVASAPNGPPVKRRTGR